MGRHREFPVENDHTITPPQWRLPRRLRMQWCYGLMVTKGRSC